MRIPVAAPLAVAALLAGARPAAAAPEDAGPHAVTTATRQVPVASGVQLATDLYVPDGTGPYPTVVMRHGFARSKANFVNWGQHLASRGFTVLVPTSRAPLSPNPSVDADDMLAVLAWAVQQNGVAGSPLEGKVDGSRRALTGHSAGGLAGTVAASRDATLGAAVLFDPVDDVGGTGAAAAASLTVPTISLFAEPGTCNSNANGVAIFQAIAGPKFGLKVTGSHHCDPEDPSDVLCGGACGGNAQPQYQTLYRRYATAFLEAFLKCDPAAYPYVNGATATGDTGISIYAASDIVVPPPGCAAADGGLPPADAGPGDGPGADGAPVVADGAPAGDAAPAPTDAAPAGDAGTAPPADGGCGCRVAAVAPVPAGLLAGLLLVAAPALGARRRRRRR